MLRCTFADVEGLVRLALDPAAMAREFRTYFERDYPGAFDVESCEILRAYHKPGKSCRVVYRVSGRDADGAEVELEYEPAVTGKFGVETPLGGGFRASGNFRFVGGQSCENPEIGGLQPLDASGSADLSLRKIFQLRGNGRLSRVDASASLRNATGATVYDQCGLPQPGRTLQFQFRLW